MRSALVKSCAAAAFFLAACAGQRTVETPEFPIGQFQAWSEATPQYRLFPGDVVALRVPSAPELDGEMTVGPDGRIRPPLVGSIMVAALTLDEAEEALETSLASQLLDARIDLTPTGFDSQRVFVGGEVATPGAYDLPPGIGALEAVMLAGGFENTAARGHVVIVRRAPEGGAMLRVVNVNDTLENGAADDVRLERFDVVFVPRSTIAEVNLFMQQYVRDALPINFGFYYDIAGNN